QELAGRMVGLDYGNGTAYAGLQMLEGAVRRGEVRTCAAVIHPGERYAAMLHGGVEATGLQGPWVTRAQKAGGRLVAGPFFHGTWVAGSDRDPALYAAFLRGVTRAVRRINADKRRYVSYFKEGWAAGDPEVQALTADDFHLGRIQLREPTPIPEDEARWAWEWMASWCLIP